MNNKSKFIEEKEGKITLTGRHVHITNPLKQHIQDKLAKVERFHDRIMDIHVTLEIQKLENMVTIIAHFDHFKVKVQASSTDMYASVDKAASRLQAQLLKWKDKIQSHHKKGLAVIDMQVDVLQKPADSDEIEEFNAEIEKQKAKDPALQPPQIIGSEKLPLKTLTPEEAVMKMELSGDDFLIFRNEFHRKLQVMYRRADGNYGLIQPE